MFTGHGYKTFLVCLWKSPPSFNSQECEGMRSRGLNSNMLLCRGNCFASTLYLIIQTIVELKWLKSVVKSFLSPEPVISWSRVKETRGSWSSRYRMSENFWHPVAHVQKLQITLLMLIMDFCPSPLHWGKKFTSWALSLQRAASLGWFENAALRSTWIHW